MICPLCKSQNHKQIFIAQNIHGHHLFSRQNIPILKCQDCSCIYPKIKVSNNFYKKYYSKNYQKPSTFLAKLWTKYNIYNKKKYIPKNCSLLDIGCGSGEFLNSLPINISAVGIDLQTTKIKNLNIINDDFLSYHFHQKFDVITFWHSLEHFSNPKKTINKSLELLNPQGQILISIPNTNSLAFKIGQKKWFHLDAPRHLFIPNEQNITKLFPQNTYQKIKYTPFEFPLDLFWSLPNLLTRIIVLPFYPIFKFFDRETLLLIIQKPN
ncbi:MAG: Methylase involved in ubiquinone/menaquinone biosynthesis [Candidatus Woesebacteria bacterium GW2011_GWC1_30_29]|nr:MAG: Methylase involved in ubiquinone/menaquinone biosynthesis [Candidatus Woesebacteria bacterium GW2011_GWC1_30_29]